MTPPGTLMLLLLLMRLFGDDPLNGSSKRTQFSRFTRWKLVDDRAKVDVTINTKATSPHTKAQIRPVLSCLQCMMVWDDGMHGLG